jgi:hypothetical protein
MHDIPRSMSMAIVIAKSWTTLGQELGQVFNSKRSCMRGMHFCCCEAKQPNLNLKTKLKQLLGSLPLAFALPGAVFPDAAVLKDTIKWQLE